MAEPLRHWREWQAPIGLLPRSCIRQVLDLVPDPDRERAETLLRVALEATWARAAKEAGDG